MNVWNSSALGDRLPGCSNGRRAPAVSLEVVRARADCSGLVVRVEERAAVNREAAAADAGGEAVAKRLQRGDSLVEVVAPAAGESLPVAARRSPLCGKRLECCSDLFQGDPGGTAGLDERDPAKGRALVAALV